MVIISRITPPSHTCVCSEPNRYNNCMKRMEGFCSFASIEEDDIATLLSNKGSLKAKMASVNAVGVLQFYLLEIVSLQDFLSLPVCNLREYNGFPPLLNITNYSTLGVDISLGLLPREIFPPWVIFNRRECNYYMAKDQSDCSIPCKY